ncbi:unnamed protein product [Adineta ricciae]|uniref:Uncharacterized protein n=1 Tax=Adineta ricciae TaxID=249248 RepID=A0A815B151_ADIRI|nr:unnamed protein product [Adineta ricciae]
MSKNLLRLCLFVNMPSYLLYLLLILLLWFGAALSRPKMQRITINHHVWEVPNEPGWDEVVKDVELVQQSLIIPFHGNILKRIRTRRKIS